MLTRRLQVLLDEARYRRLEDEAKRRGVAVAVVVREAIDQSLPVTDRERAGAVDRILGAPRMRVGDPAALRSELDELRSRRR